FAFAQNAGTLQGVVKNSAGQPLAGAFVKLKNSEKRLTFMVISQAQGAYTAKNLPPGKYVVQGIGNGFQSEWSPGTDVTNGKATVVDLSLTAPQAPHLPNAWPGRQPGEGGGEGGGGGNQAAPLPDGAGKEIVTAKCGVCHPTSRIQG